MIRRSVFLLCLTGLCALSSAVHADTAKEKLRAVENTMTRRKAEADALAQKEQEQSSNLAALRKQLIEASDALEEKDEEKTRLEGKQGELAEAIEAKRHELSGDRKKLDALTSALIDISRQPPGSLMLQSGLTSDYIHRAIYLRAILPRIRDEAEALGGDLAALHDMRKHMGEQTRLTAAAGENLVQQKQKLDQLMQARQGLLQKTQAQKDEIQAQLVSLTSQAQDLRQLLEKVAPPNGHKASPQSGPPPSLKWPVAGTQTRHFGDRDQDGVRSEGITFAALSGAPVVAPAAGKVVFAGPFKGYGPIVILQHGGGYFSFLSGFGRVDAEIGDQVEAGEPVGVMPVNGKPELYFEWRKNNAPVDPVGGKG